MESSPQDVWPLIISFMTDKTKRVMRLASTTWFNLIKYDNFTLYFTRDEDLPAISKRLSKYSWPISLIFQKHKLNNPNEVLNNIKNLTNLTSIKSEEGFNLDLENNPIANNNWMQLSTLTNIESWNFPPLHPSLELLRCFTKLKLWCRPGPPDRVHPVLKELTNIDTLIYHDLTYTWPFAFVSDPGKLTSLQFDTFFEEELAGSQMCSYLTNLKQLEGKDYANDKSKMDLKYLTALEECKLDVQQIRSFESNVNLTRLELECYSNHDLDPRAIATISHLTRLREIHLIMPEFSSWFRSLAHLSALQKLTAHTTKAQYFDGNREDSIFQAIPMTLKSLSLNADVDLAALTHLVNLETLQMDRGRLINDHLLSHFSNLTKLRVVVADEQFGDRSKIATLTKLQDLDLYLFGLVAPNINFERLVNLTKLNCSEWNTGWPSSAYNRFASLTNLQWLDIRIKEVVTNHDFLSGLTHLTHLRVEGTILDESFWRSLTNLKNLRDLIFDRIDSDENILDLTRLTNLTTLQLYNATANFTGCHITALTTLQSLLLSGPSKSQYDKDHLLKVMPYLYRASINQNL